MEACQVLKKVFSAKKKLDPLQPPPNEAHQSKQFKNKPPSAKPGLKRIGIRFGWGEDLKTEYSVTRQTKGENHLWKTWC